MIRSQLTLACPALLASYTRQWIRHYVNTHCNKASHLTHIVFSWGVQRKVQISTLLLISASSSGSRRVPLPATTAHTSYTPWGMSGKKELAASTCSTKLINRYSQWQFNVILPSVCPGSINHACVLLCYITTGHLTQPHNIMHSENCCTELSSISVWSVQTHAAYARIIVLNHYKEICAI